MFEYLRSLWILSSDHRQSTILDITLCLPSYQRLAFEARILIYFVEADCNAGDIFQPRHHYKARISYPRYHKYQRLLDHPVNRVTRSFLEIVELRSYAKKKLPKFGRKCYLIKSCPIWFKLCHFLDKVFGKNMLSLNQIRLFL